MHAHRDMALQRVYVVYFQGSAVMRNPEYIIKKQIPCQIVITKQLITSWLERIRGRLC
jgi:hypothetical protein